MTTKIYSKLDPSKLLHMIVRDIPEGRVNLCPDNQFLQCASLVLPKGTTFKAHRHNWNEVHEIRVTQESWCVLYGAVKVFFYDMDGTLLYNGTIEAGEASFTFDGFHTYEILEDCKVMEYKTGPYISQEHDKTFLNA